VWIVDSFATGTDANVDYAMRVSTELVALAGGEHKVMAEYAIHALGTLAACREDVRDILMRQGALDAILANAYQMPVSLASTCLWALSHMMRGAGLPDEQILKMDLVGPCLHWLRPLAAAPGARTGASGGAVTLGHGAAEVAASAGVSFDAEGASGASHGGAPETVPPGIEACGSEAAWLLGLLV